ncbi:hypothetical protein LINGRAHAP2_LOCUS2018, partial [Linum grandiflorum]
MELFIQSYNPELWMLIITGPKEVKSNPEKWTADDIQNVKLNAQAMNLMYCALGKEEFTRVSTCKSAKEIWNKLVVTHEGTDLVKTTRINLLKQEFEMFKMNQGESIREMSDRFQSIINQLEGLGKSYENDDIIRKLLWSLPSKWLPKVTAIQETKKMSEIKLDELLGSLLTHEEILNRDEIPVDLVAKKEIAFKTNLENGKEILKSCDNDELALLSNKISRMIRLRNKNTNEKKDS